MLLYAVMKKISDRQAALHAWLSHQQTPTRTGLYSATCVLVYSNFSIGPLQSGLSIALLMTLSSPTADTVTFFGARLDLTYPHILDTPFPPGLLSSFTFNDTNAWAGLLALQEYKICSRQTIQTCKIPHFSAMF